jgi:hypothetical protein
MNAAAQHSIEAEKGILGSILQEPEVLEKCLKQIRQEDFFVPAHRTIYEVMTELWQNGKPIDLISLTVSLRDRGRLGAVGGAGFVTELFTFVPTGANVQYYIDTVLQKSGSRKIVSIATEMGRRAKNGSDPAEMLSLAENEFAQLHAGHERRIRFFPPSELRDFKPDNELVLAGDCHIMRGEVFVIGGEPGIGKSRAATHLGICGATMRPWFGLTVRRRFKTLIIQSENGRHRLQQEFSELDSDLIEALDSDLIEGWLLVSEPPPFGLTLGDPQFQADIRAILRTFKPDCVILDPWNAATRDDKQRDYAETFGAIRALLPTGQDRPALGIVAHTRKPEKLNEPQIGGTCLLHLLAGSHILSSVPRSIFIMIPASADEEDDTVVLYNPKNNNGQKIGPSAWHRKRSGFVPAKDFDWREFEKAPGDRKIVRLEDIEEVFAGGEPLELKEAAHRLATITGLVERSAYNALAPGAKWSKCIKREHGRLSFIGNCLEK